MEFDSLEVFKKAPRNVHIQLGREIEFVKNYKIRVIVECSKKGEGCNWMIFYSKNKVKKCFQVKTYVAKHTYCKKLMNKLATRE